MAGLQASSPSKAGLHDPRRVLSGCATFARLAPAPRNIWTRHPRARCTQIAAGRQMLPRLTAQHGDREKSEKVGRTGMRRCRSVCNLDGRPTTPFSHRVPPVYFHVSCVFERNRTDGRHVVNIKAPNTPLIHVVLLLLLRKLSSSEKINSRKSANKHAKRAAHPQWI
jgi:hypothetical protein